MIQLYSICAVVGGTIFLCQFLLTLFGIGGDHDIAGHDVAHGIDHAGDHSAEHDQAASWFFSVLTFRSIVAAITFFGLSGLAATAADWPASRSLPVAIVAGLAALLLVAGMMRSLGNLRDDGTLRIEKAMGQTGTVYITIPGNKTGVGKVTLELQNRTAEYQAVTFQEQLATGSKVVVVDVVDPITVEVIAAPQYGRMANV